MTRLSREARQDAALIALLTALPDAQLDHVLAGVGASRGGTATSRRAPRDTRRCGICREIFPRCRALWSDDHDYEAPPRRRGDPAHDDQVTELDDDERESCCDNPTPHVSGACTNCGEVL